MEAHTVPRRKISTLPAPAGGYPLAIREPLVSIPPATAARYPPPGNSGTRCRPRRRGPTSSRRPKRWPRRPFGRGRPSQFTTPPRPRSLQRPSVLAEVLAQPPNGDNRLIQPLRDKHRGWAPCVLFLAAASVLVLITTAYYLARGHLPGHRRQPELLEMTQSSTPWNYASGTYEISMLNESVVAANATEPLAESEWCTASQVVVCHSGERV
ncbi:hypothetical protein MRX96_032955 [Rhipicephalus microplus]